MDGRLVPLSVRKMLCFMWKIQRALERFSVLALTDYKKYNCGRKEKHTEIRILLNKLRWKDRYFTAYPCFKIKPLTHVSLINLSPVKIWALSLK